MNPRALSILPALLGLLVQATPALADASPRITHACESGEAWWGIPAVARDLNRVSKEFFSGTRPAASLMAEGLLLRRLAGEDETRALAEYSIARSLHSQGQIHAAFPLFEAILQQSPGSAAADASLRCLNRMLREHPSLEFSNPAAIGLRALAVPDVPALERDEFLFRAGLQQGGAYSSRWLEKGEDSDWKRLARGMMAAGLHPETTASELSPVVARMAKDPVGLSLLDAPLRPFADRARLLHSRALYELGRYDESAKALRDFRRQSNDLVSGLQELTWAQLMAGKPADAVGTALGFQAGGLARVFAPESWMVMGMAFMELCRYPEARRAIERLREAYGPSAEWLAANAEKESGLYASAVESLQSRGKSTVPAPVSSEWLRSPVFQELQREINLGREEAGSESAFSEGALAELRRLGVKIVETSAKILQERRSRDEKHPELADQPLRSETVKDLRAFVRDYRVLRGIGSVAGAVFQRQAALRAAREPRLLTAIEKDLRGRTLRMKAVLADVAANSRLIEVELLQGASRELVLTNARGEAARAPAAASAASAKGSGDGWNWGRRHAFTGASEEREELWEDEIGAFQAEVSDRCG